MSTSRHSTRSLPACLALLTVVTAAGAAAAWHSRTATGLAAAALSAFGCLLVALSWFHAKLRDRESLELLEIQELQQRRPESALFSGRDELFRARASLRAFERWGVPALTLLFALTQSAAAWLLFRTLDPLPPLLPERATISIAFFGLVALLAFLFGRFAAGLAQADAHQHLRPASAQLLFTAVLFTVAIASCTVAWLGYPDFDRRIARALILLLALLSLESVILLLLEAYRPGRRSDTRHLLYESRVLRLLSQPGGLVSSAAQALDYQFGFKVSETWFYRWLERAFASLVLLQITVLWLASAIVIIDPHEEATLERFGARVVSRGILPPGLHLKWPWPIESVRVFASREARSFHVGFVPDPKLNHEKTLVWTRPHYLEEANLLVASRESVDPSASTGADSETTVPVNLITASVPIQYHVTNILDWGYRHADPALLLERLAFREVAHFLVSVDLEAIMSTGRLDAARDLRDAIQQRASHERLGVEILFVGLQDIHPPVQVAEAFEAVIGATQDREIRVLNAQAYRSERVPLAEAEHTRRIREAEAFRSLQTARARGTSEGFIHQLQAFAASPEVYSRRAYLETLVQATAGARKYLLTPTHLTEDYWINLEDKLRPDLLDVALPVPRNSATPAP